MDLYRGSDIQPMLDFGGRPFWINGRRVDRGFIVVKHHVNAMPEAIWFETLTQGFDAIDDWIESGENPEQFWGKQTARHASSAPRAPASPHAPVRGSPGRHPGPLPGCAEF